MGEGVVRVLAVAERDIEHAVRSEGHLATIVAFVRLLKLD